MPLMSNGRPHNAAAPSMQAVSKSAAPFPFFMRVESRALTATERNTVERMASAVSEAYRNQVPQLRVVGRCGCGKCPTIFFQVHRPGDQESEVCMFSGNDSYAGLVGVTLFEKQGQLSQLEYFSFDGHDPWQPPEPEYLQVQP